jgi:serine/threonine-protein kinase
MQKQRFGRFDPPKSYVPDIPTWLNDLVCQLLEKEPDKRPPDAYVTAKRLTEVVKKITLHESEVPVGPSDQTKVAPGNADPQIGATFVRDLIRVEAAASQTSNFLGRALNNTWVMLAILLIVLVGAGWMLTRSNPAAESDDEMGSAKTEGERIVQRARWRWRGGDPAAALTQLDELEAVIYGDPSQKKLLTSIDRLRRAIRNQTNTPDQMEFVENALHRADTLVQDHPDQAKIIYQGIINLYGSDRRLDSFVIKARESLRSIEQESSHDPTETP